MSGEVIDFAGWFAGWIDCSRCGKPRPNYHCWNGTDLDCPFGRPPAHLDVNDLWPLILAQHRQLTKLEELGRWLGTLGLVTAADEGPKRPCCADYPRGHAWDCPKCPK
jgi:hypothetical protein